ncbi:MAG TPA: hypothetical protein VN702_10560 [Acetobacteraceae bacterium]|nr:hypothetical protein [Acetobacteraceae bacterium]
MGWRLGAVCAALPVLIGFGAGWRQLSFVFGGGLVNPDSYMRIVRLQETLAAHHVMDVVARDGSGGGTLLHWSHLLDSVLCLFAALPALSMGQHAALHLVAMLFGPACMACLGLAVAWAAAPFADRPWLFLGPLLAAVSPAISLYGLPGVVHHHVPVVIIAVMTCGEAARLIAGEARPGAGLRLGAWAGLGLWLTPESLPFELLSFGALWLAWIVSDRRTELARTIGHTGTTFAAVAIAAFLADPPHAGYAAVALDRLSIPLVGLAVAVAAVGWTIVKIGRATRRPEMRALFSLAAGVAAAVLWVACFPKVLLGSATLMNAADWHAFMDHISEMEPVDSVSCGLQYLLTGAAAAAFLSWAAWRRRSALLFYAVAVTIGCLWLGFTHLRFSAYPEAIAAIILPIAATTVERRAAAWSPAVRSFACAALIIVFLPLPMMGRMHALFGEAHAAEAGKLGSCSLTNIGSMLAPYAGKVVLANVNDTPELLYRTGVLTVGSLYHRNVAAFLRLRAAWRSGPSDTVPPEITATRAAFVLFCGKSHRSPLVGDLPPETLLDRLNRGAVPPWLSMVADDASSGNILYRVVR